MKRWIKLALYSLGVILLLAVAGFWAIWQLNCPAYQGQQNLQGLQADVEVAFDEWGVPHIKAQNQNDAYRALGFIVAAERLLQMELMRRIAQGRMAEVLGPGWLESDRFFRTLGISRQAKISTDSLFADPRNAAVSESAQAYFDGVNSFIEHQSLPLEFGLMGITPEPYSLTDMYVIVGIMAFGFAEAFRIDPVTQQIQDKVSAAHFEPLMGSLQGRPGPSTPTSFNGLAFSKQINKLLAALPISPWIGSNAWVIAPNKTASGKAMLCNDTHMGLMLPAIWYEAYLEFPGLSHYGNYVAGIPFPLLGHNQSAATGLTMFENDDADFFFEQITDSTYQFKHAWLPLISLQETIKVKGAEQAILKIRQTHHGPLLHEVFKTAEPLPPFSISWMFTKHPSKAAQALYQLQRATSPEESAAALKKIHAPGLNVVYADADGNIAWWAVGQLFERLGPSNGLLFRNGASGDEEWGPYRDFKANPHLLNPPEGYIASANQQPEAHLPGYYVPIYRHQVISQALSTHEQWDMNKAQSLMLHDTHPYYQTMLHIWLEALPDSVKKSQAAMLDGLRKWKGSHQGDEWPPVLFHRWYYWIAHEMMQDELGDSLFVAYMNTHWMKNTLPALACHPLHPWWDKAQTSERETMQDIVLKAWDKAIDQLKLLWGVNFMAWQWGKAHSLSLAHPLGNVKPLNHLYNLGPAAMAGGNEVVNNQGFQIDSTGLYPIQFGPSMRRIIDYAHWRESHSILPSGQSGIASSPHYSDQWPLYISGQWRLQKALARPSGARILMLKP